MARGRSPPALCHVKGRPPRERSVPSPGWQRLEQDARRTARPPSSRQLEFPRPTAALAAAVKSANRSASVMLSAFARQGRSEPQSRRGAGVAALGEGSPPDPRRGTDPDPVPSPLSIHPRQVFRLSPSVPAIVDVKVRTTGCDRKNVSGTMRSSLSNAGAPFVHGGEIRHGVLIRCRRYVERARPPSSLCRPHGCVHRLLLGSRADPDSGGCPCST